MRWTVARDALDGNWTAECEASGGNPPQTAAGEREISGGCFAA